MQKIDLAFDFMDCHYDAVILVRQKTGVREYCITVPNRELELLLHGNKIIQEIDGKLQANIQSENKEQTELKLVIASQLSVYLKIPCFVGDQCLGRPNHEGWEDLHPIPRHEHEHPNGSSL